MNEEKLTILDIFRAISMQISVWRWEARMIAKYGLNWGHKEPFEIREINELGSNTGKSSSRRINSINTGSDFPGDLIP